MLFDLLMSFSSQMYFSCFGQWKIHTVFGENINTSKQTCLIESILDKSDTISVNKMQTSQVISEWIPDNSYISALSFFDHLSYNTRTLYKCKYERRVNVL
jgi:hypothetical protein